MEALRADGSARNVRAKGDPVTYPIPHLSGGKAPRLLRVAVTRPDLTVVVMTGNDDDENEEVFAQDLEADTATGVCVDDAVFLDVEGHTQLSIYSPSGIVDVNLTPIE